MNVELEYQLRERIRELESALGLNDEIPNCLHLTEVQSTILSLLMRRASVTKNAMYDVLYGAMVGRELPEPAVIVVHICNLRKRLKPHDITIDLMPGHNGTYAMNRDAKSRITSMKSDISTRLIS